MVGFSVMIAGMAGSTAVVVVGLVFSAAGSGLCLTPITSLAMTSVPAERAGMASGIMSAQRALGSTVGFAVLGSVLAASLTATLSAHLAAALPDDTERREVADAIIGSANPRAYAAEIGPGRPIRTRARRRSARSSTPPTRTSSRASASVSRRRSSCSRWCSSRACAGSEGDRRDGGRAPRGGDDRGGGVAEGGTGGLAGPEKKEGPSGAFGQRACGPFGCYARA
jgi:hypothetical protein